ncbi:3'-5' exonuclease-like [Andrographis paniculata]|uniref:3'-5' exonuclease-like n=1 Tax=Andrographis paniculata TaxID=175694 RepID=UPI0021E7615B|nr:3'-5' exonuclease-like [Andrographis paniculata]
MANSNNPFRISDHQLPYDSHNTYTVYFYDESIHTTLTHDPTILTQWISDIDANFGRRIVGLDMEWRPSYTSEQNPVATLQLSNGDRCLIFQLLFCPSIPNSLWNFLSNPNYKFVGVGIERDLEMLKYDYSVDLDVNFVDLRSLAARVYAMDELKNAGVKRLASLVLSREVEKPKRVTMSRWDKQWLMPAQVQYACIDAYVCCKIGQALNADSST